MAVDVSALLTVIVGMVPGVVAVGLAWLTVQAAIDSFRYIREALGYGGPDPTDPNDPRNYDHDVFAPDPYNNDRVNAIHEENGWEPEWDSSPSPAVGFPLPPAVVQAYADNNGIPPQGYTPYGDAPDWQDVQDERDAAFDTSGGGYTERGGRL